MFRNVALAALVVGVAGAAALLATMDGEAVAGITISNPPARPVINAFEVTKVTLSPGAVDAVVDVKAGAVVMSTMVVHVRAGNCTGIRYAATGDAQEYVRTDAAITPAAAFTSFAGAAGAFAARAAALETWLQGRLCLPQ
jgi:hypothetical protein